MRFDSNKEVLDVWASIEPRFGGVGSAASSLASAVSRTGGMRAHQIAICEEFEEIRADGIDACAAQVSASSSIRGLSDLYLSRRLRHAVASADVCHVHGLWMPHCLAVRRLASEMHKPVVSSAHGMLERWEMSNKRFKKSFYSFLVERPSLSKSGCLRALTERQVDDYRRFGLTNPVAVIPNGIDLIERVPVGEFLREHPELVDKAVVLFLGRIHHKKGILNLLHAWRSVATQCGDAHLVIAGPNFGDTGEKVRGLITALELQRRVTVIGTLNGKGKVAALSVAKWFCLPSYSEGLSVALLEALSIGVPCVVTPACNLPSIPSAGAGFETSNDPSSLADTLVCSLKISSTAWQEMSLAAQTLAASQFNWDVIGKAMASVYEWLLGGTGKPSCVVR